MKKPLGDGTMMVFYNVMFFLISLDLDLSYSGKITCRSQVVVFINLLSFKNWRQDKKHLNNLLTSDWKLVLSFWLNIFALAWRKC